MPLHAVKRLALAALILIGAAPAFSQSVTTGDLAGAVTDQTGAFVPAATVTLKSADTGDVRIILTDTATSNCTCAPFAKAFFWHRFFSHQPDLNFDNPKVMEAVFDTMRFWLDMGVDGFRLDAIPYLIERDGTSNENLPETHAVIKKVRAMLDAEYENRFLLAEANMWPEDVREYFGDGDECHMAYHFPLMPRM